MGKTGGPGGAAAGSQSADFVRSKGLPLLAHVLRRLSDRFVAAATEWEERGLVSPPRTSSTLLLIEEEGPLPVTIIAARLRQSHPLVITWLKQLSSLGLIATSQASGDRRKTLVSITPAGRKEARAVRRVWRIYGRAYQAVMDEIGEDMLEVLGRAEDALAAKPFVERLREAAARDEAEGPHADRPSGDAARRKADR
jgi:DNA-binding MarR family transcriptional regulator